MAFVNGLFHGLDFSVLGQFTAPSVPVFVQVLVTLTGWAFVAGALFSWMRGRF